MTNRFAEIAFTRSVRNAQSEYGFPDLAETLQEHGMANDVLGQREQEFIKGRDSFYLATVGETGWPYVQHRGGPKGFVKMVDPKLLAFADFRGNRQVVTAGNASINNRCSVIFMDYPNRRRLKIFGLLRVERPELAPIAVREFIQLPGYRARVERVAMISIVAFDWNCPQHIAPRYTEEEISRFLGAAAAFQLRNKS